VVLEWLRDGTRRRLLRRSVESLHNQNAAEVRLRQLVTERLRRGYVPCRPSAATLRAALRRPERHRKPPGLLGELAREVADMPRCGLDWI
jgi:predicted DNA-binding WGR domain protein